MKKLAIATIYAALCHKDRALHEVVGHAIQVYREIEEQLAKGSSENSLDADEERVFREDSRKERGWSLGKSSHMDFNERFGRIVITGRHVIYEGNGGIRVLCVVTKGLNPDGDWSEFQKKHYEVRLRPYMSVDSIGGEFAGDELKTHNWDWHIQKCRKDEGPLQYVDRANDRFSRQSDSRKEPAATKE